MTIFNSETGWPINWLNFLFSSFAICSDFLFIVSHPETSINKNIKLISKSEMSQRNVLILALSLSFGIGLYAFPEFVAHVPDLGIKLGLLLTTGLIPAGLLAFILNATLPKKK